LEAETVSSAASRSAYAADATAADGLVGSIRDRSDQGLELRRGRPIAELVRASCVRPLVDNRRNSCHPGRHRRRGSRVVTSSAAGNGGSIADHISHVGSADGRHRCTTRGAAGYSRWRRAAAAVNAADGAIGRIGRVKITAGSVQADIENKAALKTGLRCRAGLHGRSRENTNVISSILRSWMMSLLKQKNRCRL